MINYRWSCQICGAVNEPEVTHCEKCKFPAEATGEQIQQMRTNGKLKLEKTTSILSYFAFAVAGVGVLLIKFGRLTSYDWLIGLALALIGLVVIVLVDKREQ